MKSIILLFVCSMVSTMAFSQSADEKKVGEAVEAFRSAMVDPTKTNLDALTAPELSYGHSSGKIENKAEFLEAMVSGAVDFSSITLSEQTIKIVGQTALVRHKLSGATLSADKTPGVLNLGVLTVWQKQKGSWKLLARQAFKL